MNAAAQPQPSSGAELLLEHFAALEGQTAPRASAFSRLERVVGRHLATVLVRGLSRRLR